MNEPLAYLNGDYLSFREARVSVADYGLVRAATITEMVRTFGHQAYRLDEHLQRLADALPEIGLDPRPLVSDLRTAVGEIVAHNTRHLDPQSDLGVAIFVTPGMHTRYAPVYEGGDSRPTVCVHTLPLAFDIWAPAYVTGIPLVTPSVRQIPAACLNPRIKTRSRLHWYLADREVHASDPRAMALLLDIEGHVTETSSGNLLVFDGRQLLTPPVERVLDGVSQRVVCQLAASWGMRRVERDLRVADVLGGEEVFVSSTGYCLLPVTSINGDPIGTGLPGALYQRLMRAWSREVGVDIIAQATSGTGGNLK